ncbi:DUF3305 domain-containing protein [Beggiatoa leptomitoformis]|uniref:DUF3305 domain-containing protein n=1 Tax=Beggiatoa leptomitoformis TaxID=288004 RepID=A0A2N9YH05_9GAMM|nr:DUF3305 domain-containing protein [Beggiatoa leptomitoformis]ALG67969.1 DUF3305 domain-containing protein [Beggiatoa leptomitoformis]AUI69753.1 DUF3305 domain-containing protein [Beggiatoa leptomitoformis]
MSLTVDFPNIFYVSVLTARENLAKHAWLTERWHLLGVVPVYEYQDTERTVLLETTEGQQYLWTGFAIELHEDEIENYARNLKMPTFCLYVICHGDETEEPIPFLITLSRDEADSYSKEGLRVYDIAMPAEIHRWIERYVLKHRPQTSEKQGHQIPPPHEHIIVASKSIIDRSNNG